jgi:N-acyl-D-aspartate/D-glutamate deacylase
MSGSYDVLIKDTTIVDGTGKPAFRGSVGIKGEKTAAVGEFEGDGARVIDGSGLVTCPGFVDPHSHADQTILQYPLAENLVMQGITTFLGGNCGLSTAPIKRSTYFLEERMARRGLDFDLDWRTFDEWLSRVEEVGPSINYLPLVGHGAVRGTVMGKDFRREASPDEIEEMKLLVDEAMRSGAFGLSAGLDYCPGDFASVEEIVELAKVAQEYGGLYTPHTRHHVNQWPAREPEEYGYGIFDGPTGEIIAGRYHGLLEAVEISRLANRIQLHIGHITPAYLIPQPHPASLDEASARATLVEIVDKARDEGLDVTYNIISWGQSISAHAPVIESFFSPRLLFLPQWLKAMDREEFAEKLKTRAFRDKVKEVIYSGAFKFRMIHPLTDPYWMDGYKILRCKNKAYEGKTIGQIARDRQPDHIIRAVYDESVEVVFDILVEDPGATWALLIDKREYRSLPVFLKHPAGMPCTDVVAFPATPSQVYNVPPIAYGLYPHYIRTYVKEKGVLSLEEAIKKATSVPAQEVLGLEDRGVIREGAYADIVVLDFERIKEGSNFLEPSRPPHGIEHVLVNGTVVYEGMAHTGARPGKVLRHK